MKKITLLKYLAILGFAIIALPGFAKADSVPTVTVIGAADVYATDARVDVQFTSNSSTIDYANLPAILIQYTDTKTGNTYSTGASHEYTNSKMEVFDLPNLNPGTTYSYKAIMTYGSVIVSTNPSTFTTPAQNGFFAQGGTTGSTTSAVSTSSTSSTQMSTKNSASGLSVQSVIKNITPKTLEKNITNNIETGGVAHANGVVLYLTDEHARVYQNQSLTFTVKVQNTKPVDILDSRVVVSLPDQYQFSNSSSDVVYDPSTNTVTYPFGRIAAGSIKTITFSVDAVGEGNGTVQTNATLQYAGGNLSTSDHDAYSSGAKSVLGASVFGAGFFPQTFTGWFLILLLIVLIIIGARRYVKAPKPATPVAAK